MQRRNTSGLPKYCGWNTDQHGKRFVRFRKRGFSTYLTGTPWSESFMRQYAAALDGVTAQTSNIGAERTIPNTLGALIKAYLDPASTSFFKTRAAETMRTQRNILENFAEQYGQLPLFRTNHNGRRTMLLTREHIQRIVNAKASTPFAQRNFLNTVHVMFNWARREGRIPDDPTLGVTREKVKTTGYRTWSEAEIGRFEQHYPILLNCFIPGSGAATWSDSDARTLRVIFSSSIRARPTAARKRTLKYQYTPSCARSSSRRPLSASKHFW